MLAVLASTAAPNLQGLIDSRRLDGAATQLATDIQFVRSEAVARNLPVRLSFHATAEGSCYVLHTGNADQCDCNAPGPATCSGDARQIKTVALTAADRVSLQSEHRLGAVRPAARHQHPDRHAAPRRPARPRRAPHRQRHGARALLLAARRHAGLPRLLNQGEHIMQTNNTRRATRGFTMVEVLVTLSMAGVLSSVALPTFQGHLQKARRADVVVSMMQVQLAQSRWRANGTNYGTLAQIGVSSVSMGGHYRLTLGSEADDRYEVLASATGAQAGRHRRAATCSCVSSARTWCRPRGPTRTVANPAAVNRKCWNQ